MTGVGMAGLGKVYDVASVDEARALYDGWAAGYDDELEASGYITPRRCAEALAIHASLPWAPLIEFGTGTGLGGLALNAAGFEVIDGTDISREMLERAETKGVYRALDLLDLSEPITSVEPGSYQNAAAIGVLNPNFLPPTAIDEMLGVLPSGGCLVFSLNDHAAKDGSFETRVLEISEYAGADLVFKEYGPHIPEIDLMSTVYVLKRR
jgi:predicted TPR repeat methyltransferase